MELFKKEADEATENVKVKFKETEKEIEQIKKDIHFERGFRKFFFWATPLLLLAQTVMFVFSIFA